MPVPIPQKLYDSNKSFLLKLSDSLNKPGITSFSAFPQGTNFNGQEGNETIILIVRKHPIVFWGRYLLIILLLLSALIFPASLGTLGVTGAAKVAFAVGSFIFFVLTAITVAVTTFAQWFYTVNIITDQRVIDVNYVSVLKHEFAEAELEKIQDVQHVVSGFFGSIFDYGTVKLQTAGTAPEFAMIDVPRPRDVQDTLLDLMEMKQSGEI